MADTAAAAEGKSDCLMPVLQMILQRLDSLENRDRQPVCGCKKEGDEVSYAHSLIRFNETAAQVAADKLQAAVERQADRWHLLHRQNGIAAGVFDSIPIAAAKPAGM